MLFNSYIFILLFLPATVMGYFLLHRFSCHNLAKIFLAGMSIIFYGYFTPSYVAIILLSIILNYGCAFILNRYLVKAAKNKKRFFLAGALICNILILFYFKYFDFTIDTLNAMTGANFSFLNIALPLGISFFTFQQISYLIDSYRNETDQYGFLDYVVFVSFFPQLVAGPIVLHYEMMPQFQDQDNYKLNYNNLAAGIYNFVIGLSKKVLLADVFGIAVNWGYNNIAGMTAMDAIIVMLCYTFQIYFDFSGYCDMAVGIAKMFNINLPVNFNSPYLAVSILDFWNRWHITLTRFFRQYVYFPLGGSRKGTARKYVNIFLIFLLSGIWHGANWTFIVWGVIHGIANVLNRIFHTCWERCNYVFKWFCTFLFINLTWIIFRAESLQDAITIMHRIIGLESTEISAELRKCFVLQESIFLEKYVLPFRWLSNINGYQMVGYIAISFFIILNLPNCMQRKQQFTVANLLVAVVLFVWCIFSFSGVTSFLYFNF